MNRRDFKLIASIVLIMLSVLAFNIWASGAVKGTVYDVISDQMPINGLFAVRIPNDGLIQSIGAVGVSGSQVPTVFYDNPSGVPDENTIVVLTAVFSKDERAPQINGYRRSATGCFNFSGTGTDGVSFTGVLCGFVYTPR